MANESPVRVTQVAITADNYEAALHFWRDVLGLPLLESWDNEGGQGAILDAGRATIEILSTSQSDYVDQIEVGSQIRAPGEIRLALAVDDSAATAGTLEAGGAERLGGPVVTPWQHRNVRLRTPDGVQITLWTAVEGGE